jgi:hypothetical protein
MAPYTVESLSARNVDIGAVEKQVVQYLKQKGLVDFGGQFWHDKYYHSNAASAAMAIHCPTATVDVYVAADDPQFIDDLVASVPQLKSWGNRRLMRPEQEAPTLQQI